MAHDFKSKISNWDARAKAHSEYQASNPFSGAWSSTHGKTAAVDDPEYGRPKAGSRTAIRGAQAHAHVSSEIVTLAEVLRRVGNEAYDGCIEVSSLNCLCVTELVCHVQRYLPLQTTFGDLFSAYERISNKLVGILLRARRQDIVDFEGEMLFQGRDNHVIIRLLDTTLGLENDR